MTFSTRKGLKHISNSHSLSSLMGHFQPTPQNSCWARCVIMMPLPVTVCVSVFVVIVLSLCVSDISLCVSSDLPVRLHRGVPVLTAVLWRRHHNPERRRPGDYRSGPVDRLQIPSTHRSPCQGKLGTHSSIKHSHDEIIIFY